MFHILVLALFGTIFCPPVSADTKLQQHYPCERINRQDNVYLRLHVIGVGAISNRMVRNCAVTRRDDIIQSNRNNHEVVDTSTKQKTNKQTNKHPQTKKKKKRKKEKNKQANKQTNKNEQTQIPAISKHLTSNSKPHYPAWLRHERDPHPHLHP